jgi:uncharacterized protein (TIGR03083 family)
MAPLSQDRFCAAIEASAGGLATLVGEHDESLPIPTCPDWTLRQLATHVGRVHRWTAEIIRTRAAEAIPFREVPDGKFPDSRAERQVWLQAGAARLVDAVRAAGGDLAWSFTGMVPAGFWARRMAHETVMHRADAQLAAGRSPEPDIDAELAADAIDEWLALMSGPLDGGADPRAAALPAGAVLHVHATDDGLGDLGEWLIRHGPGGVTVEPGHAKGDAAISGPAASLLLVLLRRRPVSNAPVTVYGDAGVVAGWLDRTRF